jgi:hypothetical protein
MANAALKVVGEFYSNGKSEWNVCG